MQKFFTLNDLDVKGKRVLVRVDFNVPLDNDGNVEDAKRIELSVPTIKYLLEKGSKQIIIMTHVGRPKNNEKNLQTDKIAKKLESLLNEKVAKVDGWSHVSDSKLVMLENLRFNPAEKSKNQEDRDVFGKQLASLADVFVQDAFSNCHRDHASMTSVPKYLPSYAGLSVGKEIELISRAITNPKKPWVVIFGGLKADKLNVMINIMEKADTILVAGALAFTLLKAKGIEVGDSKIDNEGLDSLPELVEKVTSSSKVKLPVDAVIADKFAPDAKSENVDISAIKKGWMVLDIGKKTIKQYKETLEKAKTIAWFGPIGVYEFEKFAQGTKEIGKVMASLTKKGVTTIIGGGDSAGAVESMGLANDMTLVSSGGGASLEFFEGKKLPGIQALEESYKRFNK
ncbi:phosphoglycerate kinase [Candidatus Woesearchaeota archaeon]|nr:phosphoglycerate kinase [Candidatus Woesearchaeota archaeon]